MAGCDRRRGGERERELTREGTERERDEEKVEREDGVIHRPPDSQAIPAFAVARRALAPESNKHCVETSASRVP